MRAVAILLDAEIAVTNFRNGNDVFKGAFFLVRGKPPLIHNLMVKYLRGGDAIDAAHEFLNTFCSTVKDLLRGAGDAGFHGRRGVVHVRGKPSGQIRFQKRQFRETCSFRRRRGISRTGMFQRKCSRF